LVARTLREEISDPRVRLVTLTRIDVAPDLSHALVFWSALDVDDDPERIEDRQAGLDSAAPYVRRRAARELPLKRMPELRFRYDPSLLLGSRTLAVLRDVAPPSDESEEPGDPGEAESEHGAEK
jgi:ribosome-binding factor A